jgi:hypothetical protein
MSDDENRLTQPVVYDPVSGQYLNVVPGASVSATSANDARLLDVACSEYIDNYIGRQPGETRSDAFERLSSTPNPMLSMLAASNHSEPATPTGRKPRSSGKASAGRYASGADAEVSLRMVESDLRGIVAELNAAPLSEYDRAKYLGTALGKAEHALRSLAEYKGKVRR